MRSATTGFRLCGIADEPFCPLPNGSCTSATSVRARWRISSANLSSDDARTASAVSSSAWRSRCRICVEVGAGSRPRRSQAMRSSSGSVAAYVPTAPESLPTRIPSSARARRCRLRSSSNAQPGELQPERRRLRVHAVRAAHLQGRAVLLRPRDDDGERAVEPSRTSAPASRICKRERGVDDVGGRQPVVEPAALLAELLRDRVDERRRVVVEGRLELRDALRSGRPCRLAIARAASAGTTPSSAQAAVRRELDVEPGPQLALVRPDPGHGRAGIAGDHRVQSRALPGQRFRRRSASRSGGSAPREPRRSERCRRRRRRQALPAASARSQAARRARRAR